MPRSLAPFLLAFALLVAPLAASADAVADLHALFDREWQRDLADNPLYATYYGETRYNDRLPDISPAAQAARDAADARVLEDLARIPREALTPAERLNYDLFRHEYQTRRAAIPFHREHYSIEASSGPQSLNDNRMDILVGQKAQRSGSAILRKGALVSDHVMRECDGGANIGFGNMRICSEHVCGAASIGEIFKNQFHRNPRSFDHRLAAKDAGIGMNMGAPVSHFTGQSVAVSDLR